MIEGDWSPKLFVVQEWPSEESFQKWYNSKEYEPWKELRKEAMDMNMVLARKDERLKLIQRWAGKNISSEPKS